MPGVDAAQGMKTIPVAFCHSQQILGQDEKVQLLGHLDGHHDRLFDPLAVHPPEKLGRLQSGVVPQELPEMRVCVDHSGVLRSSCDTVLAAARPFR